MEDKRETSSKFSRLFSRRKEEPFSQDPVEGPPAVPDDPAPPARPELPQEHPVRRLLERWGCPACSMPLLPEATDLDREDFEKRLTELAETRLEHLENAARDGIPCDFDAEFMVQMAKDRMTAWAITVPPDGDGLPPCQEGLILELARAGIMANVDENALQDCLREPWLRPCVVARGHPAENGVDGWVKEYAPRQPEGLRQSDPDSPVDYRAKSCAVNVSAGDILCDIIPPGPETDGCRVDGTMIPATHGRPAKPSMGLNTQLTEDGAHIAASLDGHVVYSGGSFQVKPLLDIAGDVDYSTGNVEFRGDVHIGGDVRINFLVKATGTITIDGLVEAATVEAEGDVIIAGGVFGGKRAVIKAGRTVRARYLESCTIYADHSVYSDCIINCQVYCDGSVIVRSRRGAIIGGQILAGEQVDAVSIGSQAERKTEIILGVLPFQQEELCRCGEELAVVQAEQMELRREMDASAGQAAKYRLRHSVLAVKADRLQKKFSELREKQANLSQCKLVGGTVFPGVELTIGGGYFLFTSEHRHCTARYDEQELQIIVS